MKIVGRIAEQLALKEYIESDRPEFVAVYGRRRVGKTFLIKEYCKQFSFHLTGLANMGTQVQIRNFNAAMQTYGKSTYLPVNNWFDAFDQLIHLLSHDTKKGKKMVFFDELPWMDTHRSGFIAALEHFWNGWGASQANLLLIVCGSATSWMINKLIKNHGGLHNRVTRRMYVAPFSLSECEAFYKENNVVMNRHQMIESYMILGGVPYYLSLMRKGLSLAQNIDTLCFAENGALRDEFSSLYASLFKHSDSHIKVVEALSNKAKGLTRDEIVGSTKLASGGGLSKILEELEQCGFIRCYHAFDKKKRDQVYQLIDFYSLFYLKFIRSNKYNEGFWLNLIDNAKHRAWSGYAFEQVCLAHIKQIKNKLGITGVLTQVASWRSKESEPGAQIDLVIDRNDQVIHLCEIKYATTEFVIDKKYNENLRHKKAAFITDTKTNKAIHLTMLTTYGLKQNEYAGQMQTSLTIDDLF